MGISCEMDRLTIFILMPFPYMVDSAQSQTSQPGSQLRMRARDGETKAGKCEVRRGTHVACHIPLLRITVQKQSILIILAISSIRDMSEVGQSHRNPTTSQSPIMPSVHNDTTILDGTMGIDARRTVGMNVSRHLDILDRAHGNMFSTSLQVSIRLTAYRI